VKGLALLFLLSIFGCEVGPGDKYQITFTDTITVQYNPRGTNDTASFQFTDDITLQLKNSGTKLIDLDGDGEEEEHPLKTFAYAVGYQAPQGSDPGILTVAPGQAWQYLTELLLSSAPNASFSERKDRAQLTAYQHAMDSQYELDSPGVLISNISINSNQPISMSGHFTSIKLIRGNGEETDLLPYLTATTTVDSYLVHSQNQAVSKEGGQAIALEFKVKKAEAELTASASSGITAFAAFLEEHPTLQNHVVWETAHGQRLPYSQWPQQKKDRIDQIFQKIQNNETDLGLACPDPNTNLHRFGKIMYYTDAQAFDIYAAHVAHVLYLEKGNLVPWSILTRQESELDELLASHRYHSRILPSETTLSSYPDGIRPNQNFQSSFRARDHSATLCDPRIGYQYIMDHGLLGASEQDTLRRLTLWLHDYTGHGPRPPREELLAWIFLADRLRCQTSATGTEMILNMNGCWGAAHLMLDLARSVNIPLLNVATRTDPICDAHFGNCHHRGFIYGWAGPSPKILWHTDNIYAFAQHEPVFPINPIGNTSLASNELAAKFFDAYWLTPAQLAQFGFVYELKFITPADVPESTAGQYEDSPDFGYLAGYWLRSDRLAAASSPGEPINTNALSFKGDLPYLMQLETWYQLCNWELLNRYCTEQTFNTDMFGLYIQSFTVRQRQSLPTAVRSVDDYRNRAAACVAAYGGCPIVQASRDRWVAGRGSICPAESLSDGVTELPNNSK